MMIRDYLIKHCLFSNGFAMALLFCLAGGLLTENAFADPKRVDTADGGDCAVCHGSGKVLPGGHPATKGMRNKTCLTCHKGAAGLRGKVPLSHTHLWSGISCSQCHGKSVAPRPLGPASCLICHGSYDAVARRTKDQAVNPHQSHFGRVECTVCHKAHRKSENACNKCHEFDMKVP